MKEIQIILLGCITNRTMEEEKKLEDLLKENVEWGWIAGTLLRHRLNGNFFVGIGDTNRSSIPYKIKQAFAILSENYKKKNIINLRFTELLFDNLKENGIICAGLKGVVHNTSIYDLRARTSNDIDILLDENFYEKFDSIMKSLGFIQSADGGKTEASRKEKMIQIMNYHDLIPYYKKIDCWYMDQIKVDVNIHFDNRDNDITAAILNDGVKDYISNGYTIQGLKWLMHCLHLCVHYYREGTNSLWYEDERDIELYKLIDVENTFRRVNVLECEEIVRIAEKYKLENALYYTMYYLNQLFSSEKYEYVMELCKPKDVSYINKIKFPDGRHIIISDCLIERIFGVD